MLNMQNNMQNNSSLFIFCILVHLESWPHGINVYIHVSSMYVHAMYSAYRQQLTDMVCTKMNLKTHVLHVSNMYIHVCKSMNTYVHGMYMVCTKWPINVYVHRSNMYVHVYRFMSVFELYKHVHTLYKRVHAVFCSSCWLHSSHHTFHEMNRHCSTKYVHCWTGYVHCWTRYVFCWTGFLQNSAFDSPGLLACNLGLVAAYSSSSTQV